MRFVNVKIKKGQLVYTDNLVKNDNAAFNSLDLVIENSKYTPEYLKSIYVVDFYRILRKIEQRIKKSKNR